MRTWHHNGERWYRNDRSLAGRALRWVFWSGGWEAHRRRRLSERLSFEMLTPISVLGHRITLFGWGWNLRLRDGWLVWTRCEGRTRAACYISRDGTPDRAHCWLKNPPYEVLNQL